MLGCVDRNEHMSFWDDQFLYEIFQANETQGGGWVFQAESFLRFVNVQLFLGLILVRLDKVLDNHQKENDFRWWFFNGKLC